MEMSTPLSRFFSHLPCMLGNVILLFGILGVLFYEDWRAGLSLTVFALTALILTRLRYFAIPTGQPIVRSVPSSSGSWEHLAGTEDLRANGAVSYVMRRFYQILQRWLPFYHQCPLSRDNSLGNYAVHPWQRDRLSNGRLSLEPRRITIGTVF